MTSTGSTLHWTSGTKCKRIRLPLSFSPYLLTPLSNWERSYMKIYRQHRPNGISLSHQLTRTLSLPHMIKVQSYISASLLLMSTEWVHEGTQWEYLALPLLCICLFCTRPSSCKDIPQSRTPKNLIEVTTLQSEFRNNCL